MAERDNQIQTEQPVDTTQTPLVPGLEPSTKNEKLIQPKSITIPKSTIRKIIKEYGIEKIDNEALIELQSILISVLSNIAIKSITFTKHAKRKRTNRQDILLATA